MSDDLRVEQLLSAIGRDVRVAESPTVREARRDRVVSSMRERHGTIIRQRGRARVLRRRVVWLAAAAVLLLASVGLAQLGRSAGSARVLPDLLLLAKAQRSSLSTRTQSAHGGAKAALEVEVPNEGPASSQPLTPPAAEKSNSVARPPATPTSATASASTAVQTPAPDSELGPVNQLFAEAKRARREHRDADALRCLEELLAKYPGSVLAHEASVERFRALSRLGRVDQARRYAALYLAQYPRGFAVAEAQRLTGETQAP